MPRLIPMPRAGILCLALAPSWQSLLLAHHSATELVHASEHSRQGDTIVHGSPCPRHSSYHPPCIPTTSTHHTHYTPHIIHQHHPPTIDTNHSPLMITHIAKHPPLTTSQQSSPTTQPTSLTPHHTYPQPPTTHADHAYRQRVIQQPSTTHITYHSPFIPTLTTNHTYH